MWYCCIPVHILSLYYLLLNQADWSHLCRTLRKLIWRCCFSEGRPVFTVVRWLSHVPWLYRLSWSHVRCEADVTQSCSSENKAGYSRKTDSPVLRVLRVWLHLTTSKLKVAMKKNLLKLVRKIITEELLLLFYCPYFYDKERCKT